MKLKHFELAKMIAKLSDNRKHKMGAVIAKKGRVVSVGFNTYKTHTKSRDPYHTIHAELSAILKARRDVSGLDIYIYREIKDGSLGMARPCTHCMEIIKEAGIKNVYYTTEKGVKHEKSNC